MWPWVKDRGKAEGWVEILRQSWVWQSCLGVLEPKLPGWGGPSLPWMTLLSIPRWVLPLAGSCQEPAWCNSSAGLQSTMAGTTGQLRSLRLDIWEAHSYSHRAALGFFLSKIWLLSWPQVLSFNGETFLTRGGIGVQLGVIPPAQTLTSWLL